jgi:hypothetical protein
VLLYSQGCPQTHLVVWLGLKLMILLPQLPERWDYSCLPPCSAYIHSYPGYCSCLILIWKYFNILESALKWHNPFVLKKSIFQFKNLPKYLLLRITSEDNITLSLSWILVHFNFKISHTYKWLVLIPIMWYYIFPSV